MIDGTGKNDDTHENELPVCQGCKKSEAQFVCADCQRQWYCSRECQVMSWDEHSEVIDCFHFHYTIQNLLMLINY